MTDSADSTTPVLIAYDGSKHADAAVSEAASLFNGRPAVVVSIWRSVAAAVPATLVALPASVVHEAQKKMDSAARDEAQRLADRAADAARAAGLGARGEALECVAGMWATIVEAAETNDAAVVVVGSRGRSGIKSAVLGSVSAGVVHHSSRPVLVVRARGEAQV